MDSNIIIILMMSVILLSVIYAQREDARRLVRRIQNKRKGVTVMSESLRSFVGKSCVISTAGASSQQLKGVVLEIDGSWMTVKTGKMDKEIIHKINADYIIKICEAA